MGDYQLVLDSEALLNRLKIPAILDSYPACRLYPAIRHAYRRYLRRFAAHCKTGMDLPVNNKKFPGTDERVAQADREAVPLNFLNQ